MSSSQQQTSLDVPDISGLSLTGSKPASASSTPSIFTLLSRATYVPPPTSLTSRTPKSSSLSPANHLGSAVDPLLKHLEEPKGKENGQQTKGSADDILQKLSFLPTIGSPNQYFTTVSSWDDSKLREVASQQSDFQTTLAPSHMWKNHNGPKDGFLFARIEPPAGSEDELDLPSNMLPEDVSTLTRSQLPAGRLETIYWQARGHDGCFKSALQMVHNTLPMLRFALLSSFDLLNLKRLTIAAVSDINNNCITNYITGGADQKMFRHAVFGDTGRGPGRKGKGTFVLESLDQYYDRLETIVEGGDAAKTSSRITEDPNPAYEAWTKAVAKRVKERWEKRKESHWCGHCGSPLANGPELKRCSACREHYYCNKEHQTMAWSSHHKRWCGKS
ncbi:hypothetical protein BT96DRAFT_1020951 [Gymnopus androsaceus JB14]|uniref:MYND-type domain-containing protein n=1 Tax=Gymnopus androsaceus JB14 TaxID=1447944 RepID=A0A6A4HIC5_9AGAR|nr:hypothetical protein BT96DRAFT_1020951 [Gymnopus androsaceus JB14]